MSIKIRLIIMNFLQFAVWGAYLTSMGSYLVNVGLHEHIGMFYAMQGIVSLFMPAVLGIIADRWIPAQKLLSFSHFTAALFMAAAGYYGMTKGADVDFGTLFTLYSLSVAFYMPTLALSNSVAYTALDKAGLDTIRTFPPIRIFGTIGFICSMWVVDLLGLQNNYGQFFACAIIGVAYGVYALTLPECPTSKGDNAKSLVEALGLRAFTLFKQKKMAVFSFFSMLLGRFLADYQRICQSLYQQFRQYSRICRHFRSATCQHPDFAVANIRNTLHPADTFLPETLRYQAGDADCHAGMGIALRALRHGQSRKRRMDVCTFHDCVRCGIRFLQHIRFAVC